MISRLTDLSKVIAMGCLLASPAVAQEQPAPPAQAAPLSLELNAVQPSEKGCRLTFVVNNGLDATLSRAAFEIVLFDRAGVVDRITVLEFKELTADKTKVSRFDLAGVDCAKLGRVLVNAVTDCVGDGVSAETCSRQLKTASKAGIEFGT